MDTPSKLPQQLDSEEFLYVNAVPTAETQTIIGRKNHLICNYCCDARRGVIIVNTISVALVSLLCVILEFMPHKALFGEASTDIFARASFGSFVLFALLSDCFFVAGIFAAIKFKDRWLLVPILWYTTQMLVSASSRDFIGTGLAVFFIYPHIVLIHEIREGVVTKDNYDILEYSCCCFDDDDDNVEYVIPVTPSQQNIEISVSSSLSQSERFS